MRVVADTNVLISAIIFKGLPELFLNLAYANAFTLATSPALLDELDEKLRTKFHTEPREADRIRLQLEETALVVVPDFTLCIVRDDPDDDRILECAVASNADYILSGDRHLLKLGSYRGIEIMTVRQFMTALDLIS